MIQIQYKLIGMQNRAPLIMTRQSVNQPNQKYKFWDTAQAGNQRSPKNMSLLNSSDGKIQQTSPKPDIEEDDQSSKEDGGQSVCKSDSDAEPSEQDSHQIKIRQMEQQTQRLRAEIEEGRVLNQNLLKELNKITNQLRVAESLNTELNEECDRLYLSVKSAHDKQSEVTNQKMELLIQISSLNQTKELAVNKAEILQEQVQYLNKKIESLYEEISFQKSISADLNRQSLVLKQQLNKMMTMMQGYSELQQQVARTHSINNQIQQRVRKLEQELKNTRFQVEESQRNQEIYREEQNKLFLRIQQLQSQKEVLYQKLGFAETQLAFRVEEQINMKHQQKQLEPRYIKVLQQLEKRNSDLVFEVIALNERNHKLVEERDFYLRRVQATITNRQERLPYDQFVSILKATNDQVQLLKKKLEVKQDEVEHIKIQNEHEALNMRQKIKQLHSLLEIRERERGNERTVIDNEIQIYKKESELMRKRNQQLKNNQVKLRLQIIEKDRIIMEFIEKQKSQDEHRKKQQA